MATGLAVWLGTAHSFYGEVTVSSTGQTLPCMYGTVASALSPLLYTVVISSIRPANYDWSDFKKEKLAMDSGDENEQQQKVEASDKTESSTAVTEVTSDDTQIRWTRYALFWAIATFLGHWVLWPLPMYAAKFVFSKTVCSSRFPPEHLMIFSWSLVH